MATVQILDSEGEAWRFGSKRRHMNRDLEALVLHRSDLEECTATDLQRALREARDRELWTEQILVSDVDEEFLDEGSIPLDPVNFRLIENRLVLTLQFVDETSKYQVTEAAMAGALQPLLQRHQSKIEKLEREDFQGGVWIWDVQLSFLTRLRSLASLFVAGNDVLELMSAISTGTLTRVTAGHLVRAGRADVLIGQPEGHWLEAKSQHYDLATPGGQISLAQAVSRFCNSERGGLVVVGMRTKKTPAGEEIRGVSPMPSDPKMLRRYHQVLENRLFPPPDNLQIEAVDMGDGSQIMLIDIPPQPEELKPFLVHGTLIDGDHEGAFISIVRRRGEGSIPVTAPMIHSTLAAGRALLRRGQVPN